MLDRLVKYAKQQNLKPEPGFKVKFVKWVIVPGKKGKPPEVGRLGDVSLKNKNPGLEFLKAPDLTTYEITGGPDNCRHFLADSLEVVTLMGKSKPNKKELGKHEFFKGLLRQAAKEAKELSGLAEMLDEPKNLEVINRKMDEAGAKPTDSVTFEVNGAHPLDSDSWHGWWRKWRAEQFPEEQEGNPMLDLLTGEPCRPLESHFKISGLSGVGGLATGDSLVSFNKEAFRSFGLESSTNAAFSAKSVITYAEALNRLMRKDSVTLAGVKVAHWYKDLLKNPEEEDLMQDFFSGEGGEETKGRQAQKTAKEFLEAIREGKRKDLGKNRYYAMTLSGASGRVMLRDWMEGSFEELAESVAAWFDDLSMVRKDGSLLAPSPKLIAVLAATVRDLDEIKPPHVAIIYRCAVDKRKPFPRWALTKTVLRARADVLRGESPRSTRMGLIKAYLKRKRPKAKGGDQLSAYLYEQHPEPAYQCGRLMAVYAELQRAALGDVGAGVVQRFYSAASVTPRLVLGRLARLSQFHLNKLQIGLKIWYENHLTSIWGQVNHELPATLDMEEQGLFALGYYQQLADMRTSKKDKDQTDQTAEADTADKE